MTNNANNVVIFGATGVGKSSLINMIAGREVASTSSGAMSCTFESKKYDEVIDGTLVRLWDTAGLNEGEDGHGAVKEDAVNKLRTLIKGLAKDGVSLLVFVMRGRLGDTAVKNYRLFYKGICKEEVPIVLVVTALEGEEEMDAWWRENKGEFQKQNMRFNGQACVTTTKGKMKSGRYIFEDEYEESRRKARKLISDSALVEPWKMNPTRWLMACLVFLGVAVATAARVLGGQ